MRRSEEASKQRQGLVDDIWVFDSLQYETICRYLGLSFRSDQLRKKAAQYLRQVAKEVPEVYGFERFLAEMRVQAFELGLLDLWTRLWMPHHPWRYKLNAVVAIHECDSRGYEELRNSPTGVFRNWIALLTLGIKYLVSLIIACMWISGMYIGYLRNANKKKDIQQGF